MERLGTVISHLHQIKSKTHLSSSKRWELFKAYLFLIFKRFMRTRFPSFFDYTKHEMLGFDITIDRFESLYWIFIEIFINENYYFKTDNQTPFIVDAGSNIGYSVLYFKFAYPQSKIIAFEPHPKHLATLKQNIEKNKLQGVEVVEAGLGVREGEIDIFTQSTGSTVYENFASKQVKIKYDQFGEKVPVKIVKLSDYIKETKVDFLKVDVEGAEADIMKELSESGKIKNIDQLAMEYHQYSATENRLSDIAFILESNHFDYVCGGDARNLDDAPAREYRTFMIFGRALHS